MRLGGRLAAAIEILDDIEARHRPVAVALKDWGVSHRFAGSGDRAAIGNLVYDSLRWRLSTSWIIGEASSRALVLGVVARHWGLGAEGLTMLVEGDQHAPSALSPAEAERLTTADLAAAPDHIRADIPDWLAPKFERALGPDWIAEGAALALRPPLDLRVNRLKADSAKVLKALAKFGTAETTFAPNGLRIAPTEGDRRHPNVQIEPAFQKGWFEIQDEGSQLAAMMVGAKPGEQVLDLCAGAGGKTLALSAAMANKGQIIATDRDRSRLAPIFDRLRRAGARNAQVRGAGEELTDLEGRMDAVLVDAPCTGTGVWRRRPDAKWRLTERALAERASEQTALLAEAHRYVKPGGRLVYVTCSLLPEENEDQVAAFVAANPAFRIALSPDIFAASGAVPDLGAAALIGPSGMVLSPRRTGTDGFFISMMQRT
jgi:16S rRNA (cytosine967-C5)-methyltransferase